MTGAIPGVPSRDYNSVDRTRTTEAQLDELRQSLFGVVRSSDADGNQVISPDLSGAGWGIALPHLHVPAYPTQPYLGTAGTTPIMCWSATFKPLAQQINIGTRWAVQESSITNTAIGEYEIRWNKGQLPSTRGELVTDSIVLDSWNSGSAGSKGLDGSLIRNTQFVWPQDGSGPLVTYRDPAWVSVAVWAWIRTATGGAGDIARVAPLACYQSGIGQG